ncbi:hypothetical protein MW887_006617 [Aspergillus wentii]|nr:hypothetical protein MW887_006617 [Aspergillus wentii]
MRNPPPSRPPRSRPSAERVPLHRFQAGPPTVSVPALPQNAVRELQKGVSTATGEASLMSPVTPGATLQHHDATSSGPPAHANLSNTTTISIDESHRANIAQQPASLPSPDPSTSHTSPTSIVEGNGDHPLHAVLPSPTIRTVQTQPQSRISPLTQQTALPRPDSRGLNSPHHGEGQTTNGANHPTPPDAARPVANQAPDAINDTFWAFLTNKLDTFVARSNGEMALSETIELPRIRLLRDACHGQDLLYLALHQIYCLATFAPSELARLPGFGPQHSPGLEVVKQLLVDNSRLSGDFLKWAVHFPLPLKQMLQVPLYSAAVKQASQCLVFLSERWGPFEAQVRLRAWPPLIDELVVQFGITSSVLLSIVFLAMCRRLHGPQHEMRLRSLFHQNKRNYDRRFDKSQVVTNDQMQRENDILIKNFRALNTIPVQVAQTPSPSMAPMPPTAVSALNNGGQTMQQPIHRQPPGPIPNPRPPHMSAYVANRLPSNAQAFTLSSSDCARFPRTHPNAIGQRATRVLAEGCRTYRLRCIKVSPSAKTVEQEAWSTADAVWPSVIYIFVNNSELYVRRKVHNGKDLPLDITDYLCEGTNNISMHFIRSMVETKDLVYALGVEVMDVSGFTQVKELARTVSASETRDRIQKRLNSSAADDELSIVNDDLTINLVDPFMARIFNIPARGGSCIHEECFDLETFLKTRASKSGKGPMKDNWKCPICAEDARPQRLIIDGFLVEVRAELERTNQLEDAQTILIKANGSWELKSGKDAHDKEGENERISGSSLKRKRSGQGSGFSPAPQRPKTEGPAETSLCRNSRLSEVIELD